MYADVVLPNMGFGMEEGRIISWLKQPGDKIRKGEALVEIEGDKSTVELEALAEGVIETILVSPESVVPVGTVLARIRTAGSAAPTVSAPQATPATQPDNTARVKFRLWRGGWPMSMALTWTPSRRIGQVGASRVRILKRWLPRSRNQMAPQPVKRWPHPPCAVWHAITASIWSSLQGSGRDGRVTRADVEAALTTGQPRPAGCTADSSAGGCANRSGRSGFACACRIRLCG